MTKKDTDTPSKALAGLVKRSASQAEAARTLGISHPYLIDLLRGRRGFSEVVADKLGFKRIWVRKT